MAAAENDGEGLVFELSEQASAEKTIKIASRAAARCMSSTAKTWATPRWTCSSGIPNVTTWCSAPSRTACGLQASDGIARQRIRGVWHQHHRPRFRTPEGERHRDASADAGTAEAAVDILYAGRRAAGVIGRQLQKRIILPAIVLKAGEDDKTAHLRPLSSTATAASRSSR